MASAWFDEQDERWSDPEYLRRAVEHLGRQHQALIELLAALERDSERVLLTADRVAHDIRAAVQILGGETAPANVFPDCCLVGRMVEEGQQWFASGVLIHPRVVLTANHVDASGRVLDVVALPVDSAPAPANAVFPGTFIPHDSVDLAVMVLTGAGVPGNRVTPIALATTAEIDAATQTTVVGFGSNNPSGGPMGRKLHAKVGIDASRRGPTEFVAGGGGRGVCHGDSGGPAYIGEGAGLRLAGITSRSSLSGGNCNDPGIFTRVDAFLDFINDHP